MTEPTRDILTEQLFAPVDVRAYAAPVEIALIEQLRSEERVAIAPMTANRQAEFATARACARSALADLGVDAAVPKREGGSPAWPAGMTGSISHTRGYCVAVASGDGQHLGIDVEEIGRISERVERRILIERELTRLANLDSSTRDLHVAVIFAAKEAFYKAHYELDPRYLAFDVIAVGVADSVLSFEVASGTVSNDIIQQTSGRFRVEGDRVIAAVCIDPRGLTMPLPSGR